MSIACAATYMLWQVWPPREGTLSGSMPTDPESVDAAIQLLEKNTKLGTEAGKKQLFVDLGSGDGRIVRAVVGHFGCFGLGVDVLQDSVSQAADTARLELPEALAGRARYLAADMAHVDLSDVDLLFMYLPDIMLRLVVRKLLPFSGLRDGTLVLIHDAPDDVKYGHGLRHMVRGGAKPTSARNPPLDLFCWQGSHLKKETPTATLFFECPLEPGQRKVSLRSAFE